MSTSGPLVLRILLQLRSCGKFKGLRLILLNTSMRFKRTETSVNAYILFYITFDQQLGWIFVEIELFNIKFIC